MGRPFIGKEFRCKNCGFIFRRSRSDISRGRVHYCSKKCSGIAHTGKLNPAYKRGYFINPSGYKKIRLEGIYKYEHRHLMEQSLGRKLTNDEDVHHIDGDKLNNNLCNLVVLTKREHAIKHGNWLGENNHNTKLTADKVRRIRELHNSGTSSSKLAVKYGVDVSNVRYIVNKVTWKHIE